MHTKSLQQLISLPVITDDCKLCIAEDTILPFRIKRLYYIYDADPNLSRGFHAHKKTIQILFCLSGSVTIVLDDGKKREKLKLSKPQKGVVLEPLVWHEMHDFKKNTVLLVLASHEYNPDDYIRDYSEFLRITHSR